MKIYNEAKTEIIENPDLTKGWLNEDKIVSKIIPAVEAVQEQGHYEIVCEYENGGKDVEWVIDVLGIEAQPETYEYEDILVYIPYTQTEIIQNTISQLKQNLKDTDYQAIKYAEGEISPEDYAPIKAQRRLWRAEINRLEGVLGYGN